MEVVCASSSSAAPVATPTHTEMDENGTVTTRPATRHPPKRKRVSMSQKVLGSVVDNGRNLTAVQIMNKSSVSRSVAFTVAKKARTYPHTDVRLNNMPKVRNQELVLETVGSLAYHLVDFPYADMVGRFCDNARCDAIESLIPGRFEAAILRRKRAHRVWLKTMHRFQGRGAMNTLMCVLYSPSAVCSIVRAAQGKREHPGHVMVLRLGGVFVVLITDSSPTARLSLDWFIRRGDHTSAYMWMNLKESCWLRHRDVPSAMHSTLNPEPVDTPMGVLPKQVQNVDVFDPWSKITEPTAAGMHFLKFLRVKAEELSQEGALDGTGDCHMYIRPGSFTRPSNNSKEEADVPDLSDGWGSYIERFVGKFAPKLRSVDADPPTSTETGSGTKSVARQARVSYLEQARVPNLEQARVSTLEQAQVSNREQAQVSNLEQAQVSNLEQAQVSNLEQVPSVEIEGVQVTDQLCEDVEVGSVEVGVVEVGSVE
ncbi:hypothetical protein T484DRAFT_1756091, partial [Baffinella frigidus]